MKEVVRSIIITVFITSNKYISTAMGWHSPMHIGKYYCYFILMFVILMVVVVVVVIISISEWLRWLCDDVVSPRSKLQNRKQVQDGPIWVWYYYYCCYCCHCYDYCCCCYYLYSNNYCYYCVDELFRYYDDLLLLL